MSPAEDGGAVEAGLVDLIRTAVRFYDLAPGEGLLFDGQPDPADYISDFLTANPDAWDRIDSFVAEAVVAKDAEITRLRAEVERKDADIARWKHAFAAQSRKLQAVLRVPGTYDAVMAMDWSSWSPPLPVVAVPEGLADRLNNSATLLEGLETLPKPYDLYYAVKSDGEGTDWSYHCAHIGVSDIRAAADAFAAIAVLTHPAGDRS